MHFNFNNLQVRAMLGHNNNKLYIPRFQRDYSWEIKEVSEFVNDILLGIELKDNKVECSEYFSVQYCLPVILMNLIKR